MAQRSARQTTGPPLDGAHPDMLVTSESTFMDAGGDMGALMRSFDWAQTPLGPVASWPECLRTSLNVMLNSAFPMFVWWGETTLINLYNDAYKDILGDKHPAAFGASAKTVWAEIWNSIGPLAAKVFKEGGPVYVKDLPLTVNRFGYDEETYSTFSFSPIRDSDGVISGLFCAVTETTKEVRFLQHLQESEERFRNLADTAPMYIAMADETGNAVYFNKPWLEYTGKKLEEMKGLGWLSTLHPEDAPRFEKDFKQAFRKHLPINQEYRFRRCDGEYRWMLAVGAPRFTPDGHFIGYFGTYTDFHELKKAQIAVQEREERFRTLIERSADAVQLVSPVGEILFSSDSIKNVLGYTPEEIAHNGVAPFLHPDDKEYFFEQFNDLIKHPNKQILMQYRVRHKDGTWAWLETIAVNHLETPNINALVGNFRNVTRQKQAEDKLRRSEERFRALADNIPNLAWMAKPDGYIYWYNNRWYKYTGTTPGQMEGWGWHIVHDPTYLPRVMKSWKHSIKSGQAFEMVFPIKGADGSFRPFLTRVLPLRAEDGTIEQWVGTNTDISQQFKIKQAEARAEKLAVQRKELIELNQAKDEFISLASHQLRTPATGVKQYLGMLLAGYADELTAKQKDFVRRAYEGNEREIAIINDLLRVAQVDAGRIHLRKEPVDFVRLIQAILDEYMAKFLERNHTVIFEHSEDKIVAAADESRMRMVLENLVDNASKYTPPYKEITITLSKSRSNKLCIKVRDEGVGLAQKDKTKIFDKFVRVENPLSDVMGGSGLGLYLVKRIISVHNGTITLSSKLGKGSTFTVLLPLEVTDPDITGQFGKHAAIQ